MAVNSHDTKHWLVWMALANALLIFHNIAQKGTPQYSQKYSFTNSCLLSENVYLVSGQYMP